MKKDCDNACRDRRRSALMTSATMLGAIVCAVAMLAGCATPGPAVAPKAALTASQAGATGTATPWQAR